MRQRDLLRELKHIQAAFSRAPLNWLYNPADPDRNGARRAAYVTEHAAKLAKLLPDIIAALDSRRH